MRTVKNRKRKFALGMKIAAMFSCIAIASVGFAAWIIVNDPQNVTVEGGQITAETVSETGLTFGAIVNPTAKINFGKTTMPSGSPAKWPDIVGSDLSGDDYTNYNWLVADDIDVEVMRAQFTVPYTPSNVTSVNFKLNINAYYGNDLANDKLQTLITKGYIKLGLAVKNADGSELYDSGDFTEASNDYEVQFTLSDAALNTNQFVVHIEFSWGDAFKGYNPYVYFNGHAITDIYTGATTMKEAAKTALSDLYTVVNNVATFDTLDADQTDDLNYKVLVRAEFPTPTP